MEPSSSNDAIAGWKWWKRRRHIVALLAFFGFFNIYSLRVNLSVAIVSMNSVYTAIDINGTEYETSEFNWDTKTQGIVLSSFFYGYIMTQLLGGWLAVRFGGSRVYCFGIGATAFMTLITPPLVSLSVELFIIVRIIEGLFEGVTYPCMHAVWSKWAPPSERALMASFAFSGSYAGTVVALPLSGLLAEYFGWPSIFYVTGIIGLIWCSVWWIYVKDNPEDDPYITDAELKFLKETLGETTNKQIKHPWKEILTSVPVWAIVVSHTCENWGFYTLLTQLPTFMKETLHFDISKAGFLSSVPYLVMAITMQFAGRLADWLNNKQILSTTNVRKLFNCGAFIGQTIFMLLAAYLLTATGVITCLVFAVGLGAFAWPAFSINHLDLAPQHASILMGLSNTFATLPGILSPIVTGFVVVDRTEDEWRIIFFIASGLYLLGTIFYALFASAELQPWAIERKETKTPQVYDNADVTTENL